MRSLAESTACSLVFYNVNLGTKILKLRLTLARCVLT